MRPPTPPAPPRPGPLTPDELAQGQPWAQIPGYRPGLPVGAIIAFAGQVDQAKGPQTTPSTDLQHTDWRLCDGSALLIKDYPDLFDAIGFLYGKEGNAQFLLPNFAGYFLRAVDPDGKVDPDADKRTPAPGWDGGKPPGVGSTQDFALQDHKHYLSEGTDVVLSEKGKPTSVHTAATPKSSQTGEVVDDGTVKISPNETRSVNMAVYWLIKCWP